MNDVTTLNSSTSLTANELPNEVFRNYDIRGFAHSQITPDFAFKLGAALAITLLKQQSFDHLSWPRWQTEFASFGESAWQWPHSIWDECNRHWHCKYPHT